jgi:alanine racemase
VTSQVRMPDAIAGIDPATACAEIDLAAFRANVTTLRAHAGVPVMVVVKADGYGHGILECAREARAAGAEWLGVATPAEALQLREAGDTGPVLAWLYGVDEDLTPLVAADVDVSAQSVDQIGRLVTAAAVAERRARVHLKIDTGLSRNGATSDDWQQVCARAAEAEHAGAIEVIGIWSHLAAADEPGHPSVPLQIQAFQQAYEQAIAAGLEPALRHLGNSAGALVVPEARLDLVRVGIAAYGIDPAPGIAALAGVTLRPVMRLRAQLVNVKKIAAGAGVSYGWTWIADAPTTVGLVPLGYGDGIPRHAGNRACVGWSGAWAPIRGRICMDQFVVDLGADRVAQPGDEVILFGPGDHGEPTAADWAAWCDTIGYEIVTRIGSRVPRRYLHASPEII